MIAALTACSQAYRNPNEGQPVAEGHIRLSMRDVDPSRAESAARAALARGDRHLLGAHEYASFIPGAAGAPGEFRSTDWPDGVLCIEDTGDVVRGPVHRAYIDRAVAYATAYNRVIFATAPTPPRMSPHPRSPG